MSSPPQTRRAATAKAARAANAPKPADPRPAEPPQPAGATSAPQDAAATAEAAAERPAAGASGLDPTWRPLTGRIPITDVRPLVDGGRRPARAVVGETFEVSATIFREGHDAVGANVVLRDPSGASRGWIPMRAGAPGTDRWHAQVTVDQLGAWTYQVQAWSDPMATWLHAAEIKVPAGVDVGLTLEEGARLLERAAEDVARAVDRTELLATAEALRDRSLAPTERLERATAAHVRAALADSPLRDLVTDGDVLPLWVERERALYGAWYEFFPRSEGAVVDPTGAKPPRSGTLRTAAERLPAVAAMGFDVVYLPPVHPIGASYRKGANNALRAGPHEPGSPWAIGGEAGGHDAIHPDLGTLADFDHFVARAGDLGLEVALDFALQASPDHPWVTEHPEWFRHRADGTIAYAENPPKKYQDIYPIYFDNDPDGLVAETLRILRHWMAHGVRIFRVDNPHTKPVNFWERVLADIRATDPDVIFLAEAFTRPAMMHMLAKIGFQQSYTYFTWRNGKAELTEYLRELSGDAAAYMRPNFFVNTPDILHAFLQHGGRPAFKIRATLAAMLSPTWGVYSGFELFENTSREPGSEEYLDTEKFQYRPRDWAAAEAEGRTLAPYLTHLNELRRAHPALHELRNLVFHDVDNDSIIAFSKRSRAADRDDVVLVVVNLNPHAAQEATVHLDMSALGLDWGATFPVRDELSGAEYRWGKDNYVRLDPAYEPAHVFTIPGGVP